MLGGLAAAGADVAEMLLPEGDAAGGHAGFFLHVQLALEIAAPHGLDEAAVFLLQLLCLLQGVGRVDMVVHIFLRLVVKALLHIVQQLGEPGGDVRQGDGDLLAVVAADGHADAVFDILGAKLHAERHTLHLVLSALPAQAVVAEIDLGADSCGLDLLKQSLRSLGDAGLMLGHGHHNHLDGRDAGRQNKAVIVAVGHDDTADNAGGHAPGGLEGVLLLVVLVGEGDVELPGKAIAEEVAGAGLEGLLVVHHALDGVGIHRAGELLLVGLVASDHRHGKIVLTEIRIHLKLVQRLLPGLLLGGMEGVAFLPQKLSASQEGAGGLFPTEHRTPLVVQHGQVTPGMHNMAPVVAEKGLGGRTDAQALGQLLAAAYSDPGTLGGEALHMILLLLKQALGDEHGHGDVLVSVTLEHSVQLMLNVFPNRVTVGAHDKAALDAGVVNQLSLGTHIGEPLGKVYLHIGYLFNFLVFCHNLFLSFSPGPLPRRISDRIRSQNLILACILTLVNSGVTPILAKYPGFRLTFFPTAHIISLIVQSEVTDINKQKFLAELARLLNFMYEEDRQEALAMYEGMFDEAGDEQALLQALVSPTRQAVVIARAYNAKERKLQVHAQSREESAQDGDADFVQAINQVRSDALREQDVKPVVDENQFSLFDDFLSDTDVSDPVPVIEETVTPAFDTADPAEDAPLVEPAEPEPVSAPAEEEPAVSEEQSGEADVPEAVVDQVDAFLADFSLPDDVLATEDASQPAPKEAELVQDDLLQIPDQDEPVEIPVATEVLRQPKVFLLILYIIFAIPLTLAGIIVLLVPTLLFLALAAGTICAGIMILFAAFSGFTMFSDLLVVLGLAIIVLALGLLFLWIFIWFIGGAIVGLVRGVIALGEHWCYKEVAAE